jgi:hypothetical protein
LYLDKRGIMSEARQMRVDLAEIGAVGQADTDLCVVGHFVL